jgi:acetolactate decarboxylase
MILNLKGLKTMRKLSARFLRLGLGICLIFAMASAAFAATPSYFVSNDPDLVYHVSTFEKLQAGDYYGKVPLTAVLRNGDFGIGTFVGIDGEMIIYEGKVWQGDVSGKVNLIENDALTPFAMVTDFAADISFELASCGSYGEIQKKLLAAVEDQTMIHAVKVHGTFPYIKYRSVPGQTTPYPGLADVVAQQKKYERYQVAGTVVGFWYPDNLGGVQTPGFHLHFISDDHQSAGHILELAVTTAQAELDVCNGIYADLTKAMEASVSEDILYRQSIDYLLLNRTGEVYQGLSPLDSRDQKLRWKDGLVLMYCLTPYASSYPVGESVKTSWGEIWLVPEYQMLDFAQKTGLAGAALQKRLEKYLGLPLSSKKKSLVGLWVDPQQLFRPTKEADLTGQVASSGLPANPKSEHYGWFVNNIATTYFAESEFPWTRLGYTFDWGNPSSTVGANEYVLKANSEVVVEKVIPLH